MTRGSRAGRLPLGERTAVGAAERAPSRDALGRPVLARHCWVVDAPDQPGRWAGLVVEWRQEPAGWLGRVVFAVPETRGDRLRVVERWLPADCLEPVR